MGYNVLIVDDSKLARMTVTKALNTLYPDWTRVEVANADEALAAVRAAKIDVALLDYNMPGRDGLALAKELRALDPSMPVAVISANNQMEIVEGTNRVGATFLAKPLTQQALAAFLTDAVARLGAAAP
jgi:CheY-like chemotaxis protein